MHFNLCYARRQLTTAWCQQRFAMKCHPPVYTLTEMQHTMSVLYVFFGSQRSRKSIDDWQVVFFEVKLMRKTNFGNCSWSSVSFIKKRKSSVDKICASDKLLPLRFSLSALFLSLYISNKNCFSHYKVIHKHAGSISSYPGWKKMFSFLFAVCLMNKNAFLALWNQLYREEFASKTAPKQRKNRKKKNILLPHSILYICLAVMERQGKTHYTH